MTLRRMFIEPGHSVIDPAPPAHALLSQNVRQHLQDLRAADVPPFDPADHHPHMLHDAAPATVRAPAGSVGSGGGVGGAGVGLRQAAGRRWLRSRFFLRPSVLR